MADKTNAPAAGETWPPDDLVLFLGPAATAVVTVADGGSIPAKTLPLPGPFVPYFPFFVKNLSIYRVEGGIKLGPVLGIIVEVPPQAMYPRDLSFYQRLINYSNSRGLLTFLFTPADLDLKENIITGYTAVGDNTWRLGSFPLPDVVYNRVGFLTPQTREAFPTVYTFLNNHPGIKLYNPGGLDKWSVYSRLASKKVAPHLPLTVPLQSFSQLVSFLARHGKAYLKPSRGSHGQGIIFLATAAPDIYRWASFTAEKGYEELTLPPGELGEMIPPLLEQGDYLIQGAIDKICYNDQPVDFRAHLHKDGRGDWQLAVLAAKVGTRGAATTNLHTGGRHAAAGGILEDLFPARGQRFLQGIRELALAVARELDTPEGYLAELGLDIAIDTRERLWLIEANDRPGHFGPGISPKEEKRLLQLIVEHAVFLAGLADKPRIEAVVSPNISDFASISHREDKDGCPVL
ncbi:MAG: YheC/YheD family protein [bacterium]